MRLRFLIPAALLALCLPAFAEKVKLGKLGQILDNVPIYSKPSQHSHVYYHAKTNEYVVIQSSSTGGYYRVLLKNGGYGYVPDTDVAKLAYDVVADEPAAPPASREPDRGTLASRGRPDNIRTSANSRAQVANYSQYFAGVPYKWGGNDPTKGIDCSAFVKFLYGQIGLDLPRTAHEQAMVGTPITRLEDLRAGDRLYFWSSKRGMIGHTGIYLGGGYFEHASSNHHGVARDYLGTKKWLSILVAARR
jgi:cell wall-associated NlpC family hydrolase